MAKPTSQTRPTINVTQADIDRAQRNDSYTCVVAQALARAIPDATHIEVDSQQIRFSRGDFRYLYLTPYAAAGYVIAFDAGEEIHPFKFQLRDPIVKPRKSRSEAGRARNKAATKARSSAKKAGKGPAEASADARAAYAAAAPDGGPSGSGTRARTPRVFKKRARAYGSRLLRINQEEAS